MISYYNYMLGATYEGYLITHYYYVMRGYLWELPNSLFQLHDGGYLIIYYNHMMGASYGGYLIIPYYYVMGLSMGAT